MRRSKVFNARRKGRQKENSASNLFTKIMQKQRNQFIKANQMQKETTANYRHTESLFYYYFTRQGLTTHTHPNPKERKR